MLFLDKCRAVHGNKYNYSKVNYINNRTKITIICPIHGEFEQNPKNHIMGHGCMKCAREKMSNHYKKSIYDYLEELNEIHNNKYKYDLSETRINKRAKIKIICPDHGEFEQLLKLHLKGHGCPDCGLDKSKNGCVMDKEDFLNKAKEVHGDKYDYSLIEYINNKTKVKIICPDHGTFEQIPNSHLSGKGCQSCPVIISKGHQELINFLGDYKLLINDRTTIYPNELDIYLPDLKLAIEFHGNYWHSYDRPESRSEKYKHRNKYLTCSDNKIKLIQIFEYEWNSKKEIVKSILNHKLGRTKNRVYARNCAVKELVKEDYKEFVNICHIQGYKSANVAYGLYSNDEIVSVMSFDNRKGVWEINRFCNRLDHAVVGGGSKLFYHFIKQNNPKKIITFADARYSDGDLYRALGFEFEYLTRPNYKYLFRDAVYARQQFMKHKLKNKLNCFDSNLTEAENMFNNGYRRIWDAGNNKFIREFYE